MKKHVPVLPLLFTLLAAGAIAPVIAVGVYRYHFDGPASTNLADWGQFGDYLGGTLNPFLAFLSFTALVVTLAIQTRQLELSTKQLEASEKELEATRLELQRSADAQVATSTALTRQAEFTALSAKVTALSVAIRVVEAELEKFQPVIDPSNAIYAFRQQYVDQKEGLMLELNSAISQIRTSAA